MAQRQSIGDIQRNREIHDLLDQIEVPEESMSDLSSDLISARSTYEPESQGYSRNPISPSRPLDEYFNNSMNSSIAHTSPIDNVKLNFAEESPDESNHSQQHSQAFTSQQVSRMMDWSKNHITATEGLFPQVSAPSMCIDPEVDF